MLEEGRAWDLLVGRGKELLAGGWEEQAAVCQEEGRTWELELLAGGREDQAAVNFFASVL